MARRQRNFERHENNHAFGPKKNEGSTWHLKFSDKCKLIRNHGYFAMATCAGSTMKLRTTLLNWVDHFCGSHGNCVEDSPCKATIMFPARWWLRILLRRSLCRLSSDRWQFSKMPKTTFKQKTSNMLNHSTMPCWYTWTKEFTIWITRTTQDEVWQSWSGTDMWADNVQYFNLHRRGLPSPWLPGWEEKILQEDVQAGPSNNPVLSSVEVSYWAFVKYYQSKLICHIWYYTISQIINRITLVLNT